ncbi:MAG: hypothetical protein P8J32_08215 [bacterium]|nr:hypothetical protein [bacterium]
MRITNNRSRGAWFNYRVNGMPKRVYLKGYETLNIPDITSQDQTVHNRTISNFAATKPIADSAETTSVITTKNVQKVNDRKVGYDQQTDGNFEVEYTTP